MVWRFSRVSLCTREYRDEAGSGRCRLTVGFPGHPRLPVPLQGNMLKPGESVAAAYACRPSSGCGRALAPVSLGRLDAHRWLNWGGGGRLCAVRACSELCCCLQPSVRENAVAPKMLGCRGCTLAPELIVCVKFPDIGVIIRCTQITAMVSGIFWLGFGFMCYL